MSRETSIGLSFPQQTKRFRRNQNNIFNVIWYRILDYWMAWLAYLSSVQFSVIGNPMLFSWLELEQDVILWQGFLWMEVLSFVWYYCVSVNLYVVNLTLTKKIIKIMFWLFGMYLSRMRHAQSVIQLLWESTVHRNGEVMNEWNLNKENVCQIRKER